MNLLRQHSALPVVFILVLLSPLAIDVYLPAIPEMTQALNTTDGSMQFSISLFMMFMGAGQLVAGPLSDRYGRCLSAATGVVIYLAGAILAFYATSIEMLYVSRALQGLGAASCSVTAFAWARENFPVSEARQWIGYLSGVIAIIPTLAPMLGGLLTAQWGWEANFVFMGGISALLLVGVFLTMQSRRPAGNEQKSQPSMLTSFVEILSNRQFLIYSLSGALTMAAILSYVTYAPSIAMTEGGLDEYDFALLFGLIGLLQLAGGMIAPRIVAKFNADMAIFIGVGLSIFSAILLVLLDGSNPLFFFAAVPFGCMGFCMIFGSAAGKAMEPFSHCAGSAAALDGFFRMAGGGVIATLIKLPEMNVFHTTALSFSLLLIPAAIIALWKTKRVLPFYAPRIRAKA
ncbi:hypothetical protein ACH42_12595 [Endozoicomonas sp. (ex Bugula neritina AB1)]|nr:hypothetical protein ACH42_12595 [Endozoicomonas sp. (ex Bugula neritina AB1)]